MYNIKTRINKGKKEIFDPIRCMYVSATPEEYVRQAFILHLLNNLKVPKIAIAVEKQINYNGTAKRFDIAIQYKGKFLVIVECKAPSVNLSEDTLLQASIYNKGLFAEYIVLINGKTCLTLKRNEANYQPIDNVPSYHELILSVDKD